MVFSRILVIILLGPSSTDGADGQPIGPVYHYICTGTSIYAVAVIVPQPYRLPANYSHALGALSYTWHDINAWVTWGGGCFTSTCRGQDEVQ